MKRSKYGNKKVVIDGIGFASGKEGRRYEELKLLERCKLILCLELQPKFLIIIDGRQVKHQNGRKAVYTADFKYHDVKSGKEIIEDVKSKATRTEAYVLRKAIIEHIYNVEIIEV